MTDFTIFVKEYGDPVAEEIPDPQFLERYRKRLPSAMLEFWKRFGFGRCANGLVWVTNPNALGDILDEWTSRKRPARAIPVIRTAFAKIVYWDGAMFRLVDPNHNDLFEAGDDVWVLFNVYLIGKAAREGILQEPLFKRALRKLGPLQRDEMYGYKLPLAMGGEPSLQNLEKMKMREQLAILAQVHGG